MALKRFTSILSGKRNPFDRSEPEEIEEFEEDTPEANISRSMKLFCESGTRESTIEQGEEVLQLPVIVEAAESSPPAAAVAATHIRKYLSQSNSSRPLVQYNAIMLMRILVDNPGPTFTRNVDAKFVSTVKDVLRNGREQSVQAILRETLMSMYREKAYDTNLANLFAMWQKESGISGNAAVPNAAGIPGAMPTWNGSSSQRAVYQSRSSRALPPPGELAQRIEEARTSAKLLQQLVQSTPQADLRSNDLIKEFADRCRTAQRSVQGYISADDPMPDDDTMQTMIETSEQLSLALSKHSRALLQARRAAAGSGGNSPSATPPLLPSRPDDQANNRVSALNSYAPSPELTNSTYSPPPLLPPSTTTGVPRRDVAANHPLSDAAYTYSPPPIPPPGKMAGPIEEDPFADEHATGDLYDSHTRPLTPPGGRPVMQNTTSSYVRRQDDAEENFTMHGGRDSTPVSPNRGAADVHRLAPGEISPLDPKIKSR